MQDIFLLTNLAIKLSYNVPSNILHDFYILQEKLHFSTRLARYVQDLMKDFASLVRRILARLAYFLQEGFYSVYSQLLLISSKFYILELADSRLFNSVIGTQNAEDNCSPCSDKLNSSKVITIHASSNLNNGCEKV